MRRGAITLVVMLLVMAAAFNLSQFPGFKGSSSRAEFTDASGIHKGNMVQVGVQSQQLLADFIRRQSSKAGSGEPLDPLNLTGAFTELLRGMIADPSAMMEAQFQLWRDYMSLWQS